MLFELIPMTVRMSAPLALAAPRWCLFRTVWRGQHRTRRHDAHGRIWLCDWNTCLSLAMDRINYRYRLWRRDGAAPRHSIYYVSRRPDCQRGIHQPP